MRKASLQSLASDVRLSIELRRGRDGGDGVSRYETPRIEARTSAVARRNRNWSSDSSDLSLCAVAFSLEQVYRRRDSLDD